MGFLAMGRPKPLRDQMVREYEDIFIPCINTTNETVVHDQDSIIALINASGEMFNSDDAPVDLNDEDQKIFHISVRSYFCDSVMKGANEDGSDFVLFDDSSCVKNANGDVIMQLFQGGEFILGDSGTEGTDVVIDETVEWPCGSGGVYCVKIVRIRNRNEIKPVPEIIIEPLLRCSSYTNLGPTMTYGPNGFLENAALFNDPPTADPDSPNFTCTNHYPICIEVENAMVSTDSGGTWTNLNFPVLTCYEELADVPFKDAGYGLGFSGLTDIFDQQLAQYDMGMKPANGNTYVVEYGQTASQSTHMFKIVWRWVLQGTKCESELDPWHKVWTNEWQYAGSDGQCFLTSNGNASSSSWSLPGQSACVDVENCQPV